MTHVTISAASVKRLTKKIRNEAFSDYQNRQEKKLIKNKPGVSVYFNKVADNN